MGGDANIQSTTVDELYLGHPECLTILEKSQEVTKLDPCKSEPWGHL